MNISENFLSTLRSIGFPQVNAYKTSDFESLVSDPDLKPLFESVCNLTEESFLAPTELAEYEALSPAEISYYEKLAEDEDFLKSDKSEAENREEFLHLEEYLSIVEEEKKSLLSQKDLLKLHENQLLTTKAKLEKELVDAQKQFELYSDLIIPQAEFKLSSNLKSVTNSISELQALIKDSGNGSRLLSAAVYQDLEDYFGAERKVLDHVKNFLQHNIEVCYDSDNSPSLKVPGYLQSRLLKEVHHLKNVYKKCKVEEFSANSDKLKLEATVKFLKTNEDKNLAQIFEVSTSQLRTKIIEEERLKEQLLEKENIARLNLTNALVEHTNYWSSLIGETFSQEVMQFYQKGYEYIQEPLETMLAQRSRLELISLYLSSFRKSFENVKNLVDSTSSFVEKEKGITGKMKDFHGEKNVTECVAQSSLPESLVLKTVDKILNDNEDTLMKSSSGDILKKIRKIFEELRNLEKLHEDKLHHLHLLEEQRADLKKYAYKGKPISDLIEAEANFNLRYNKLSLKKSNLVNKVTEDVANVQEKEKMLEMNRNLQLCRRMFIDAILDPDQFHKHIEKIKIAYEMETSN